MPNTTRSGSRTGQRVKSFADTSVSCFSPSRARSVPLVESFFSKKKQGIQHPSDLVLSRSRTWITGLSSCGVKADPLSPEEITRLLYEEASLDGNHIDPAYILRSPGFSGGEDSFLNIREKLSITPALFHPDHFQVGRLYGKTFYVSEFPDFSDPMFLSQFLTQRENFKITLFARGIDQAQARANIERQLKGDLGTLQKGNLVNVDSKAMMDHRQGIMEAVARGETKLIKCSLYLTAYADSYEKLTELSDNFASRMSNVHRFAGYFEQKTLFQTALPQSLNVANKEFLYTTRDAANCWPFFQDSLAGNEGVPFGISLGSELVTINPWSPKLENWNQIVIGKAGTGKSFSVQQQIVRHLPFNPYIMVIDKSKSYEFLCKAAGGDYVHVDLESKIHLNVFEYDREDLRKNEGDVSADKVSDLLGFLNVLLAEQDEQKLPNLVLSHLDEAIRTTYKKKLKSTPENPIPKLSDLKTTLDHMAKDTSTPEEFRTLCRKYTKILDPYTGKGTYANLTDRETAFNIESPFIVFDTSNLPDALVSLGVYIISQFCITKAIENKKRGRRSWLLLDETWFLARFPAGVAFLLNLAKRSRHLALASIFATQQISDFLKNPDVRPVVDNASTKIIFRPGESEIPLLGEMFGMNPKEIAFVSNLQQVRGAYSQCYGLFGTFARGLVYVTPDPVSYWITTTHPDESLERDRYIKRFMADGELEDIPDPEQKKRIQVEKIWSGVFSLVHEKLQGKR